MSKPDWHPPIKPKLTLGEMHEQEWSQGTLVLYGGGKTYTYNNFTVATESSDEGNAPRWLARKAVDGDPTTVKLDKRGLVIDKPLR